MAQHDFNIANAGGATVRADINNVLAAIQSSNSGTSAPSSTAAGMLWLDTSGGLPYALKIRDGGNNHWLTLASVTDPGSDGNIETSATIKGTIDSTATMPAGSIVQVVNNTDSSRSSTTLVAYTSNPSDAHDNPSDFGTWADLINCSITPKYANSKILINFTARFSLSDNDDHSLVLAQQIGSTYVSTEGVMRALDLSNSFPSLHGSQIADLYKGSANAFVSISDSILDNPSSTGSYSSGSITYSVRIARYASGGSVYRNRPTAGRENANGYDSSGMSTMVLLEVKQ